MTWRRSWKPVENLDKIKLSKRKRTARLENPSLENGVETAYDNRKERRGFGNSGPDVSKSMIDMKRLLEKLKKKAEISREEKVYDIVRTSGEQTQACCYN